MEDIKKIIESAWDNRELLKDENTTNTIRQVIELLDKGKLRVAEPTADGWQVNEWVKKAVVLYFPIQKMETLEAGIFEYHDKMPLKTDYEAQGVRVVPGASARQGSYLSSDTVQVIGHYPLDLQKTTIDFLVASAHKFHGPKGVGFAYFRKGFGITPMLHGGSQEKGARSSTENVHAILGMEKALTIANDELQKDKNYIESLKVYFISELKSLSNKIEFNGLSEDLDKSTYTILNVRFPVNNNMLLFSLDLAGVAVSGGSACQSGSNKGSHVLSEFLDENQQNKTSVRFSFSKYTTKEELDYTIEQLKKLL